jgi:hypothetical protein
MFFPSQVVHASSPLEKKIKKIYRCNEQISAGKGKMASNCCRPIKPKKITQPFLKASRILAP